VLGVEGPGDPPRLPGTLSARPNPARSAVALVFHLEREQDAHLRVTDVQGRRVTDRALGRLAAGAQRVEWDGRDAFGRAPAGIYFCAIETASGTFRQRVVLLGR
jgi:flagellar hook assembly protein FlgD